MTTVVVGGGGSVVHSDTLFTTSSETEETSSDALASIQIKIKNEILNFLYMMQYNHRQKGVKIFLLYLLSYVWNFWTWIWTPVLSATDFHYAHWGSWLLNVLNYPVTFSMDIMPYMGSLVLACFVMFLMLVLLTIYSLSWRASRVSSRYIKIYQQVIYIKSFLAILLTAPSTFVMTAFVDCSYGSTPIRVREALLELVNTQQSFSNMSSSVSSSSLLNSLGNSTTIASQYSLNVLNRYPEYECFGVQNVALFSLVIIFTCVYIILALLSTFIIPNSHPRNFTPMIFDSLLLQPIIVVGNILSILVHYMIPPHLAYVRSIFHIIVSILTILFVFKTVPMMRRVENTLVGGAVCARLGTSIGGLISFFVNSTNEKELGIGMAVLTVGMTILFALIGSIAMEFYTRFVIKYIRNKYMILHEGSSGTVEREASQIYSQVSEDDNFNKLLMFIKFTMMKVGAKLDDEDHDLAQSIAFIRAASASKSFTDFNLLVLSSILVAYVLQDDPNAHIFSQALLKRATKRRPNIYRRYIIGQKMKEIEVFISDETKSVGNTIELKTTLAKIQKSMLELTSLHRHFWKEMTNEIIDHTKIEKIMIRCSVLINECDVIFSHILAMYYNDKTVLRQYAQYVESFKFNKELANEYYNEATSLEEDESLHRRSVYKNSKKTKNRVHPDASDENNQQAAEEKKIKSFTSLFNSTKEINNEVASEPSLDNFNGIESATNEAKREMVFRTALSIPAYRFIQLTTYFLYIAFALALLVVGVVISYIFSMTVTKNVTHVIDACSPIYVPTNVLVALRGYQIYAKSGLNSTSSKLRKTPVTELFMDTESNKKMIQEARQVLIALQQKAYDAQFEKVVYSYYHEQFYPVILPKIGSSNEKLYNTISVENATITDINNLFLELTDRLLRSEEGQMLETFSSYAFMLIFRNQHTFTQAYSNFCMEFMDNAMKDALQINNIVTIYTAVSLSIFFLFSLLYLVYERLELTVLHKQVNLLHSNVSKNEMGRIFHMLSKKVGDEVSIHISKNALFKPQNFFLVVTALLTTIVIICGGIFLNTTLGNSTYCFESYVTIQDSFDTLTYLQETTFSIFEIYVHRGTMIDRNLPLLSQSELSAMISNFDKAVNNLRYFWNLCMYGSSTKAYDTLVVGMFPEIDQMIRGELNCTLESVEKSWPSLENSSCEIGIDYMIADLIANGRQVIEDVTVTKSAILEDEVNVVFSVGTLLTLISKKLVHFASVFAQDSSTPIIDNLVVFAIFGFLSLFLLGFLMFQSLSNHSKTIFALRTMFNYLNIETVETNDKLKNFVLYHTVGDGIFSKIFQHSVSNSEREDAKLLSIINGAVDGVVMCNSSMGIDVFNAAAQRMFGYQSQDVVGNSLITLFVKEKQEEIKKMIESMKNMVTERDPKGETTEVELQRKNQTTFPGKISIFVTLFQKKHVITCFIKDITPEKKHNALLAEEKKNSENLLLNILPAAVANQLKSGASLIAEKFPDVTCFFSDMVGFTSISSKMSPSELVQMLNIIVIGFDDLTDKYRLEKVKTIGDAYFCAGGLHSDGGQSDSPERMLRFAMETFSVIRSYNAANRRNNIDEQVNIRVGINTGAIVAGVIGRKKFAYDMWGDTINVASRMESTSKPGRIQISRSTYERVYDLGFTFEERKVELKGKGLTQTYMLNSKHHVSAILTNEEMLDLMETTQDNSNMGETGSAKASEDKNSANKNAQQV
nr:unnamed protein product [Naegleria fowleri]